MSVRPPAEVAIEARPGRYDITLDCVHCGLCLPVCPTYLHLGDEADSPRGRIYLMRAHDEGRQPLTPGLLQHLDRCLVCRACETACPSGVQFGSLIEDFRAHARPTPAAAPAGLRARLRRALGTFVLRHVLPNRRRLRALVDALYLYQVSGASRVVRTLGLARALGMQAQEAMAPHIPPPAARRDWPATLPAVGNRRARVLFLRGCIMPEVLPEVQQASIAVLRQNGCEVLTPPQQTCCGALHFHTGERRRGLELLAQNLAAFDLRDVDALVVNAAGCGSTLKEYGILAQETPAIAAPAASLARSTKDIAEFLAELGLVQPSEPVVARIAYDEPCHLLHGQRVSAAPRSLLAAIPGATLVPLADADRCCGSAGIYNLMQPALATAVLDEKVRAIAASGAEIVASGNPGCILWIRHGIAAAAVNEPRLSGVRVMHPVELLAQAYGFVK